MGHERINQRKVNLSYHAQQSSEKQAFRKLDEDRPLSVENKETNNNRYPKEGHWLIFHMTLPQFKLRMKIFRFIFNILCYKKLQHKHC